MWWLRAALWPVLPSEVVLGWGAAPRLCFGGLGLGFVSRSCPWLGWEKGRLWELGCNPCGVWGSRCTVPRLGALILLRNPKTVRHQEKLPGGVTCSDRALVAVRGTRTYRAAALLYGGKQIYVLYLVYNR